MKNEIWKPLIYNGEDFGDTYEISSIGRLRNITSGTDRKLTVNKNGYLQCVISRGRERKIAVKIHRAVAENFTNGYKDNLIVNHKDGNKKNNRAENLEWVTNSENTQHAYDNDLNNRQIKIKCLNTGEIFPSIAKACEWCGLNSDGSSIRGYLNRYSKRKFAGRHPITKEPLQWCYV